ncbi:hypothetical protein [Streptomyces sp. NPDC056337]|uniref:hypothetical protein n=1 Tax=Streptomyces sp. NPDC056337 TaxID=3345787 RepID=UPI0035E2746E
MEDLPLHELRLLRGAVEGCDTRYISSLRTLDRHACLLLRAGLLALILAGTERDDECQYYEATAAGREFYAAHLSGLDEHAKGGRASPWRDDPKLAAAARALDRLLNTVERPAQRDRSDSSAATTANASQNR